MSDPSSSRHFTGVHHYEGESYGPFSFLNPTVRKQRLPPAHAAPASSQEHELENGNGAVNGAKKVPEKKDEIRAQDVYRKWRSRDNRKGKILSWRLNAWGEQLLKRCSVSRSPCHQCYARTDQNAKFLTPLSTSTLKETLRGIWRMFSTCPYWDVSYLVAVVFTLGSVIWCINAFFVWLPLQDPSTEFSGEIEAGGWTAFVGATIFEFGSVLLMIEAINENRADCFGWELEHVLEEKGLLRLKPSSNCKHHHKNKGNLVGKGKATEGKPSLDGPVESQDRPNSKDARRWTWFPTWHELTTHYFKELGFLACSSQMFGATVFWISGFTAIPGISERLTTTAAQNGAFWAPQVIGGTGFIVSGILFMLETQQKWYLPAYKVLGWHIGAWNLVGGIGFTLCGALGFAAANSGAVYQGSLATFWGSWCFLIGSTIQWFEALDKHPVDIEERGGRVSDTQPVA